MIPEEPFTVLGLLWEYVKWILVFLLGVLADRVTRKKE